MHNTGYLRISGLKSMPSHQPSTSIEPQPHDSLAAQRLTGLLVCLLMGTFARAEPTIHPLTEILLGHQVGGVSVDAVGDVYVADFGDIVWKITPDGQRRVFAEGQYGASGNALDHQGNLYQSSYYGNFITKIDRTGHASVLTRTGLNGPVGIAIDQDSGELFVANCSGNTVSRVASDGTTSVFAQDPRLKCPNGITFDRTGTLYVVNFRDDAMLKIDHSGHVEPFATVSAKGLGHVCFHNDRFFVTAFESHEIYEVTLAGTAKRIIGNGTRGLVNGAGSHIRLSFPNGIACDPWAPRLYINEYDNDSDEGRPRRAIVREIVLDE
jgi:DNA-binding beta-propeller fold protein YncE